MASKSRDASRDREFAIRHHHSSSDISKTSLPMWDSSDPERAPPPLPLNPSSPGVITKPNTSATVAAAAAALTERARESAGPSAYTTNPMPIKREGSPDKSLIKGHHQKRIQTLHSSSGNVKDLSSYLENNVKSPETSPERFGGSSSPVFNRELPVRSPERSPTRMSTPISRSRDAAREGSGMRLPPRQQTKCNLAENAKPDKAAFLALPAAPFSAENDSLTPTVTAFAATATSPKTFDALSNQILSLTSIATNLQREMTQLSRRSKDNATDLVSLKEATNARDEDIRESLKELVTNLSTGLLASTHDIESRPVNTNLHKADAGAFLLDDKPHVSPQSLSRHSKNITLPRIPTPRAFAASLERDLANSPSPYREDGPATLALLEKILRDMGTKEGQERLICSLSDFVEKLSSRGTDTTRTLEEMMGLIKDSSSSRALVAHKSHTSGFGMSEPDHDLLATRTHTSRDSVPQGKMSVQSRKPYTVPSAVESVGDDIHRLLRRLKDSVSETGGMTAEIKALVRELRGEVLGMGRELGRKLNEAGHSQAYDAEVLDRVQIMEIMQNGINELRGHIEHILSERPRQLSASENVSRAVDSQEVYEAVRHAFTDLQPHRPQEQQQVSGLEKEEILNAVREAWETYKPEIELQNFGLERDEVLECLKEGLEEFRLTQDHASIVGRDEVIDAIRQGLENFQPPNIQTDAGLTREDILIAVRESLENFDFPTASRSADSNDRLLEREDVMGAVMEGLHTFDFQSNCPASHDNIVSHHAAMLEAVQEVLKDAPKDSSGLVQEVLDRLHELMEGMRIEFKGVSDEAKQNVAANGRDTEQVLDALKDGLEHLRSDVEAYVDRAADVTGKDEIIQALREGFDDLRIGVGNFASRGSDSSSLDGDALESMKGEFEHLRETIATTFIKSGGSCDKDEILDALREGFGELRLGRNSDRSESTLSGTEEFLDALNSGLEGLRTDVAKMMEKPVDMTVSYEILDTLKDGLAGVRADLDRVYSGQNLTRELGPDGGQMVVAESLKRNDIENLEVLITQLRIKVEALDAMYKDAPHATAEATTVDSSITKDDLANLEETLRSVIEREHVEREDAVKKEDIDAIENLLINTKAILDEMVLPNAESSAKQEQVEEVAHLLQEIKETMDEFAARTDVEGVKKEDVSVMETMLSEILVGLQEFRERVSTDRTNVEQVTRTNVDAIAELCADTKLRIEEMDIPRASEIASKSDIAALETFIKRFRDQTNLDAEANAQAVEARRLESEGLAERLGEVKGFLKALREDIKGQLDDGSEALDALSKTVEGLGESIHANASVNVDIKEVADTIAREFERSHGQGEGLKQDNDQNSAEILQKLEERFDEIIAKYDEAQIASQTEANVAEGRAMQKDELLKGTKAVTEEVKLLIDTLGLTMTEWVDRMAEDSKTVFNRINDTQSKIEEGHNEIASQHQRTQEEVHKAIASIESLHGEVSGSQTKILTSLEEVLAAVGKHYDHAKQQSPPSEPTMRSAQPAITGQPLISDNNEKYDDAEIHSKLDKLINHSNVTGETLARISLLDQIQIQVASTAAQVSESLTIQSRLLTDDHSDRDKLAEEAAVALEKRLSQREIVEAEVVRLNDERTQLASAVEVLRVEKEELAAHRTRLSADVASLETALRIRHEELITMEARAEGLERRILEGVIDHSRALLISRPSNDPNHMSLKRVTSQTANTLTSLPQGGIGMALKSRPPPLRVNLAGSHNSGRRILSLNHISGNAPGGAQGLTQPAKETTNGGLRNLKRSHSVRTSSSIGTGIHSLGKQSWSQRSRADEDQTDKENAAFGEEENSCYDDDSDTGTERRSSYTTSTDRRTSLGTITGTLGTDSTIEEADEEERTLAALGEAEKEMGKMIIYDGLADSGMGDEIATADLHPSSLVWPK